MTTAASGPSGQPFLTVTVGDITIHRIDEVRLPVGTGPWPLRRDAHRLPPAGDAWVCRPPARGPTGRGAGARPLPRRAP